MIPLDYLTFPIHLFFHPCLCFGAWLRCLEELLFAPNIAVMMLHRNKIYICLHVCQGMLLLKDYFFLLVSLSVSATHMTDHVNIIKKNWKISLLHMLWLHSAWPNDVWFSQSSSRSCPFVIHWRRFKPFLFQLVLHAIYPSRNMVTLFIVWYVIWP